MADTHALDRLPTGVRRLDLILNGGLVPRATYALFGPPGSGKTVLANQIAANQILEGRKAVYVTLLSEGHARMLEHLDEFEFFDRARVGRDLLYLSGFRTLEEEGLKGLLRLLREILRRDTPDLLVVDGFQMVEAFEERAHGIRRFVHELQTQASMADCTVLLLRATHDPDFPEATAVDGVVGLDYRLVRARAVRELTVYKFRGSDFLPGRHEVDITSQGVIIHPRTEARYENPPGSAREDRVRMGFGVARLDEMVHGGVYSGSTTTLLGAPGTGKTLLGLHFLVEGARQGQPGIYFGFYETPPRLLEKARGVGLELERYVEEGLIELVWQAPLEHNLDGLAEGILERIERRRPEKRQRLRLMVDDLDAFRSSAVYPERLQPFFAALAHQLRAFDVTTLMVDETGLYEQGITVANSAMVTVVENIIYLRYVELRSQLYRLVSILKMRESAYDSAIREFTITGTGVVVAESFQTAEAVLTGQARVSPQEAEVPRPLGTTPEGGEA